MIKLPKEDAKALRFVLESEIAPGTLELDKWDKLPFINDAWINMQPSCSRDQWLKKYGTLLRRNQNAKLYVNDYLSNALTRKEAILVNKLVVKIFADAQMELEKIWVTNAMELRAILEINANFWHKIVPKVKELSSNQLKNS